MGATNGTRVRRDGEVEHQIWFYRVVSVVCGDEVGRRKSLHTNFRFGESFEIMRVMILGFEMQGK